MSTPETAREIDRLFGLFQRADVRDRPHKSGLDALFAWDYMGSAEYEYGALGESLRRMRPTTLARRTLPMLGLTVHLVGHADTIDERVAQFSQWVACGARSRDGARFLETITGTLYGRAPDGWWALNAGLFFTLDETVADRFARGVQPTTATPQREKASSR